MEINNFFKNKKVLVTGSTGFKGSWLCLWLSDLGANVYGVSLKIDSTNKLYNELNLKNFITNKQVDIKDFNKISKIIKNIQPDIIFHLAAQSLVIDSYKEPIKTWDTNLNGTINILQSLKLIKKKCGVVFITTDKVYENNNRKVKFREGDSLGGHDPYSASKAASEIAIKSWRDSFFIDNRLIKIASARAGNVIGGGDWSKNRIIPDIIKSLLKKDDLLVRSQNHVRPWQHVLDPLYGYMLLSKNIYNSEDREINSSYNFGPNSSSIKPVKDLIKESIKVWGNKVNIINTKNNFFESEFIDLDIKKSKKILNWKPVWDFKNSIKKTILWYKEFHLNKKNANELCTNQIVEFENQLKKNKR